MSSKYTTERLRPHLLKSLLLPLFLLNLTSATAQRNDATRRAWNRPVEPFRVIGNIYYVGVAGITSFLITTPKGHILLDGGLPESVPHIRASIKKLGFRLKDVKILLNSHAHFDHAGGFAELKRLTGAKLMATKADARLLTKGGKGDFIRGEKPSFPPVNVDRFLHDTDTVTLNGITMIARLTPGHTRGCTTWTMKVRDAGRNRNVVFVGSTTISDYKLVNNTKYPQIASDFAATFALLKSLPCDIFLGPHEEFFGLEQKRLRQKKGTKPNPFIDPQGYHTFLKDTENDYKQQLQSELHSLSNSTKTKPRTAE